ncbi:hypothetical protein PF005_g6405 [Phytophthora fragariae]|uniref:Uncharacterized protein n=1 Tax=Phytophthora fragariae TaxID=53985 RepID=A0A6A3FFF6_9STRA|nr:hypothetical protein PF003_g39689 [Phytophthora fragariae]KAE8891941.1 hypothetical protein PF003_g23984 [Phytophthora fragariae]KAE8943121.1 hypothetical protein PF009_g7148 [Phytophthora fragariae]KAE9012516.1 hypothetical protein PF011_g8878 [Phytophthora fragariae]KAE9124558.1 hypothetical protein PF007_g6660 [Phytophthora fragariae]
MVLTITTALMFDLIMIHRALFFVNEAKLPHRSVTRNLNRCINGQPSLADGCIAF